MSESFVEFGDRKGAANAASKLTDEQVQEIRALLRTGAVQASIAKAYGVTPALVSLLKHKRIWAHLPDAGIEAPSVDGVYTTSNESKRKWHLERLEAGTHLMQKLMPRDVRRIRQRLADGEQQSNVARSYGVSRSLINHIKHNVAWQWLGDSEEKVECS